jgi:hypothetical protein
LSISQEKIPSLLPEQQPLLSAAYPPKSAVSVDGEACLVALIIASIHFAAMR